MGVHLTEDQRERMRAIFRESPERVVDLDIAFRVERLERLTHVVGEIRRVGDEGEVLSVPDTLVELCGFFGPERQHKAVEDDLPNPGVDVHDPGVAQELTEVLAERLRRRRFGRAQLDVQDLRSQPTEWDYRDHVEAHRMQELRGTADCGPHPR